MPPFFPAIVIGLVIILGCTALIKYRRPFTAARDRIQRETYGRGLNNIARQETLAIVVAIIGFALGLWIILTGVFRF